MNAKDLTTALRGHETVTFETRNLGSTTYKTKEFEEAVNEIESALSRYRIRDTATEPQTREDASERGFVLAWCGDVSNDCYSRWCFQPYWYVSTETAKLFPRWTQLPKVPDDNT